MLYKIINYSIIEWGQPIALHNLIWACNFSDSLDMGHEESILCDSCNAQSFYYWILCASTDSEIARAYHLFDRIYNRSIDNFRIPNGREMWTLFLHLKLYDNKFEFNAHINASNCKIDRTASKLWSRDDLTIEAKKRSITGSLRHIWTVRL